MKAKHLSILSLFSACLAASLIAVAPMRGQDSTMDSAQVAAAVELHFLAPDSVSAAALLAPPPLPDSSEQAADMDEVQKVYHAASTNDVFTAYSEKKFSVFNFTSDIGAFFIETNLPKTTSFFKKVQRDAAAVTDAGKDYFKRPRPFVTDPSLANGKLEKSFSYPSGHSTESMVLALVLADLFPGQRDAIIAHARAIGWRRVEIARHYPTDIYAGRTLAQAIVHQMKSNPQFQKDLGRAKDEIAAVQTAARN